MDMAFKVYFEDSDGEASSLPAFSQDEAEVIKQDLEDSGFQNIRIVAKG